MASRGTKEEMWMNKHNFRSSLAVLMEEETQQNKNKCLLDVASALYITDNLL